MVGAVTSAGHVEHFPSNINQTAGTARSTGRRRRRTTISKMRDKRCYELKNVRTQRSKSARSNTDLPVVELAESRDQAGFDAFFSEIENVTSAVLSGHDVAPINALELRKCEGSPDVV